VFSWKWRWTQKPDSRGTRLVHPYDVGQSLNPDVHDQQLYGGAYPGIGVSATEAIFYDPRTGVRLNDNLLGYPILTILDVGDIEAPIVQTHLGWSAYGLCGCSEAGKAATAAALLVPAVYNAIGKWIEETPVTPERVLRALGKSLKSAEIVSLWLLIKEQQLMLAEKQRKAAKSAKPSKTRISEGAASAGKGSTRNGATAAPPVRETRIPSAIAQEP